MTNDVSFPKLFMNSSLNLYVLRITGGLTSENLIKNVQTCKSLTVVYVLLRQ